MEHVPLQHSRPAVFFRNVRLMALSFPDEKVGPPLKNVISISYFLKKYIYRKSEIALRETS
jgi:hypothetical protein